MSIGIDLNSFERKKHGPSEATRATSAEALMEHLTQKIAERDQQNKEPAALPRLHRQPPHPKLWLNSVLFHPQTKQNIQTKGCCRG